MINSFILIVGLSLQFFSEPADIWALLLIGRMIWGIGCGVIAVLIPMYLSEIAPQRFMGAIASLHGMALGFGSLIADTLGLPMILGSRGKWSWEYLVMIVLQIFQLFVFGIFCHESPKDLYIRQGKIDKAIKAIKFYQNPTQAELELILEKYQRERQMSIPGNQIMGLLKNKRLRMSVYIGIGGTCCYALGAMQIITNYSTVILTHVGASYEFAMMISLGIGILRFISVFPSMYIVEKAGRRVLLLASVWGCLLSFFVFMVAYAAKAAHPEQKQAWSIVVAFFLLFYGVSFSIGCQTIGTFLAAEVVPTQDRSANQGFAVMWRFVFALITTFAFYPLLQATNWGCWLFLIIPLLVTAILMQKYMPETKNRSIGEILAIMNHEEYEGSVYMPLTKSESTQSELTERVPTYGSSNNN